MGQQKVKKEKLGVEDPQLLVASGAQAFLSVSLAALHACMGKSLPLWYRVQEGEYSGNAGNEPDGVSME